VRAIHLLGLRDANGTRLRFVPDDDAPLIIPWWIPEGDREVLLAFYQQTIADDLILRIEVDWHHSIVSADRTFLASERQQHGAEDRMVVVRVRREGVDLHDVLGQPEVRAFRRVAVVCEAPVLHETIGVLQQLGRLAVLAAEHRYERLAIELGMREDYSAMLGPIQQQLLNPIVAVECFNMLIDVHAEGIDLERHELAIITRVIGRSLDDLSARDLVALIALVVRGDDGFAGVTGDNATQVRAALRDRMLVRDGRLAGWARWLPEDRFRAVMMERIKRLAAPRPEVDSAKTIDGWMLAMRGKRLAMDPVQMRVVETLRWGVEGKTAQAHDRLDVLLGELRSTEQPVEPEPWMTATGRDAYGVWADARVGGVTFRMRWIPPGWFVMGSPDSEFERHGNEGPRHEVVLTSGYWLGETQVTQSLWAAVMGSNPSKFQHVDRPVEQVSWNNCAAFIAKLNHQVVGIGMRLPTEVEWEHACRAGTTTSTWMGEPEIIGPNNATLLDAIAWYSGNSGVGFELENGIDSSNWHEKQYPHTTAGTRPVGLKAANPLGLRDMLGNVWEWCSDWRGDYDASPAVDPTTPEKGTYRVLRGGSWSSEAGRVRAAARSAYDPDDDGFDIGFRLARSQSARR
jgi:formylglycine-generating enzyme required for sulfatase activity